MRRGRRKGRPKERRKGKPTWGPKRDTKRGRQQHYIARLKVSLNLYVSGRRGRLGALTSKRCGQTKQAKKGDGKGDQKETKREAKRDTQILCRFALRVFVKHLYFGPALATGRFDLKALWAEKGSEQGKRKGMRTRRRKGKPKGTQITCIFRLTVFVKHQCFGPAWATGRFDVKGFVGRQGRRTWKRQGMRKGRRKGIPKRRPKGDET